MRLLTTIIAVVVLNAVAWAAGVRLEIWTFQWWVFYIGLGILGGMLSSAFDSKENRSG